MSWKGRKSLAGVPLAMGGETWSFRAAHVAPVLTKCEIRLITAGRTDVTLKELNWQDKDIE